MSAECGGGHDLDETAPQRGDHSSHAGDKDYAQTRHRDGQIGIRGSRQQGLIISSIRAPKKVIVMVSTIIPFESRA